VDWSSFAVGGIGVPAIIGLSTWLGKVWANRILEKDRVRYQTEMERLLEDLRTRQSKELFVHRLQFEKEFDIYKELWVAVLALARTTREFRAVQVGPPRPQEDILTDFVDACNRLNSIVFDNRPFYAPEVFEKAKATLELAWEIDRSRAKQTLLEKASAISDKHTETLIELEETIQNTLGKVNDSMLPLCEAIRTRIWSTTECGWDRGDKSA
jgi:hypothetical protein